MDEKRQIGFMSTPAALPEPDPRRQAILAAAAGVFARYGFRRTSMEDIAEAAGLSRAGLYLHYRNKQDIFRSMVQAYFDRAAQRMEGALAPGLAPEAALQAAFEAKLNPELAPLFNSPHGPELLDVNRSQAADLVAGGEARLAAVLARWLAREAGAGRLTLAPFGGDAAELAGVMIASLTGLKQPGTGYDALRAQLGQIATLFGRGLRL